MKWILYTDGASRGNPGLAGAGALLVSEEGEKIELRRFLGERTNNQAEYEGLLLGLERLKKINARKLEVRADSELMIRQLKGEYRVKNEHLKPLYERACEMLRIFESVALKHIPREENREADRLSNEAIDHSAKRRHKLPF